jgi:ankyrin repeat protein
MKWTIFTLVQLSWRQVVEALVTRGAEVGYVTRAEAKTALIHASFNGAAACVNILLDKLFERYGPCWAFSKS